MTVKTNQLAATGLLQKKTFKKSLLAVCVVTLGAQAYAQTAEPVAAEIEKSGSVEEVVITGMRKNLQNAQDLKRNADTVVDTITATDIGSLPDRSVLEAMQRLPGVSIEHFQAASDPDHFSVEGSGAVIRGMSATRSEFNGRDSFTANSGRGLSFQDVPPELMSGVDVYKNQSADMIEGGIGGTVSLRTRKPFDSSDRILAFSADGTWGDLAEELSPSYSGLFSDTWDTSAGEFGFLINAAYSELVGESHGIQSDVYKKYKASAIKGAEEFVGDGTGTVWMPQGSNLLMKEDDRERQGLATAFQWRDNDGKYQLMAEFIHSDATLSWWENAVKYQGGYTDSDLNTRPYLDSSFAFNEDGLFQSGLMSHGNGAWRATSQLGVPVNGVYPETVNTRYPNPSSGMPASAGAVGGAAEFGHKFQLDTRGQSTNTLVDDFSVGFKWTPDDAWTINLDVQHIEAETKVDDLVVHLGLAALQDYDLTGGTPHLTLLEPWGGARDNNPTAYNNGVNRPGWTDDPAGDSNYFTDITSYWYRSATDHYERSDGDSNAVRLDIEHAFEDAGFITSVQGGLRYAERDQTVRSTGWNWGPIAPEYLGGNLYLDHVPEQSGYYSLVDWSDFHRGNTVSIQGGDQLNFVNRDVVEHMRSNPDCDGSYLQKSADGNYKPYACRDGVDSQYGIFLPGEVTNTVETNNAAYVRVDFGSDDTALRYSGNVGLRYVEIERTSTGYVRSAELDKNLTAKDAIPAGLPSVLTGDAVIAYADQQIAAGNYADYESFFGASKNSWVHTNWNYLNEADRAYGQTGAGVGTAVATYDTVLPSLNLKVELTDDLIGRFAASKAMALPDMSLVRNNISMGTNGYEVTKKQLVDGVDPATGKPKVINYTDTVAIADWTGSGGNTYLTPMESDQFDVSLEWYFSRAGSVTGTVFYKDLSNFFVSGASRQAIPHPINTSEVRLVDVDATRSGGDGTMQGIELAYQQFFDFLPVPFDGFGVQTNYTYIDASGVPNGEQDYEDAGWVGGVSDTGARVNLDSVPLQGQSEHTANFVLMYEKYDWSARLAYNWRSKYLLTTRDVISKYPLWNDDAGFLDGSVFYQVSDSISIGLQATNLLDTVSKTIMILDDGGTQAGRSWFIQDRRVSAILRATF
jgi:iron complex outermembrane receptor protein